MAGYLSGDIEKVIMKYLKQIDAEPDEIGDEIVGQFELHYFDTSREKEIMKKLKDAHLDPDFAGVNSLENKGYREDEIGDDAVEWFEVRIYPNWNDDMTGLLDDDDNPIEVKSLVTAKTKLYMGLKTENTVESLLRTMTNQDSVLKNLANRFQGTLNPDFLNEITDLQDESATTMNELAELDHSYFTDTFKNNYPFQQSDNEFHKLLVNRNCFPVILEAKGEDWYRHELGIFGEDFDQLKKKFKIKSRYLITQ